MKSGITEASKEVNQTPRVPYLASGSDHCATGVGETTFIFGLDNIWLPKIASPCRVNNGAS